MPDYSDTIIALWNWTGATLEDPAIVQADWGWTGITQERATYAPSGKVQTVKSTVTAIPD